MIQKKYEQYKTCLHLVLRKKLEALWEGSTRFISQMTAKCDPIFKMLRKHNSDKWDEKCQVAFDKVKEYLTNAPVLVPPVSEKPLILYLTVQEISMGCVLGQHDETGRKEQAIYYLSKKFTDYESKYLSLEKICCALA